MVVGGARHVAGVAKRPLAVPEPEGVWIHVVGDVEIDVAVAIDVGGNDAEGAARSAVDPRRCGDIAEGAVAVVAAENVRLRLNRQRAAKQPPAGDLVATETIRLRRPLPVPADVEVEESVAVGIDEGGTRTPPAIVEACRRATRFERAVATVVEENVAAIAGEEQIGEAVAVMVADGDAVAIAGVAQSTLLGDVVEPPAASIAIAAGAFVSRQLVDGEGNATDEDEIVASVEIEVDRPEAAAIGRGEWLVGGVARAMDEIDARYGRDVGEPDRAGGGLDGGHRWRLRHSFLHRDRCHWRRRGRSRARRDQDPNKDRGGREDAAADRRSSLAKRRRKGMGIGHARAQK